MLLCQFVQCLGLRGGGWFPNSFFDVLFSLSIWCQAVWGVISKFANQVSQEGLSSMIAFEIASLALLLPLSADILARTVDRYKSDVISKRVEEAFSLSRKSTFFILVILLSILFQLWNAPCPTRLSHSDPLHSVMFILVLILFLGCLIMTYKDIQNLQMYSSSDKLFDEYLKHAEKIIQ